MCQGSGQEGAQTVPGMQDGEGRLARDVHLLDLLTQCSAPRSLPPGLAVYPPRLYPSEPRAARLQPEDSDHTTATLADYHLQETRLHSKYLRGAPGVRCMRATCGRTFYCTLISWSLHDSAPHPSLSSPEVNWGEWPGQRALRLFAMHGWAPGHLG